jgi:hypothetical protein
VADDRTVRASKHRWPICEATGKQRLGERKDTKLALEASRRQRARAEQIGVTASWTIVRAYRCHHCSGWHATSSSSRRRAA